MAPLASLGYAPDDHSYMLSQLNKTSIIPRRVTVRSSSSGLQNAGYAGNTREKERD